MVVFVYIILIQFLPEMFWFLEEWLTVGCLGEWLIKLDLVKVNLKAE